MACHSPNVAGPGRGVYQFGRRERSRDGTNDRSRSPNLVIRFSATSIRERNVASQANAPQARAPCGFTAGPGGVLGSQVSIRARQPGYMDTPEGVGAYFLDPDANLIELWAPRAAPAST